MRRGKPAPDGYNVAMRRFQLWPDGPGNVVVFEHSINGVRSAVAAGMRVVMVPSPRYFSVPEDCEDRVELVVRSLAHFRPETMGLPSY